LSLLPLPVSPDPQYGGKVDRERKYLEHTRTQSVSTGVGAQWA
jgi:hypothetical protein